MAVSPDDRFAGLISSSAERGGWVPGDVFASDSEGEVEPVEPRRVRLPVLVAVAVAMVAVLVVAFLLLRPAQQHSAGEQQGGSSAGGDTGAGASGTDDSAASGTAARGGTDSSAGGAQEAGAQEAGAQKAGAQSGGAQTSGEVVVHVTGQVHKPSVVTLDAGARVQDAVEAAGGLKFDADAESINLARVLQDGEQVHIPARGENPDADSGEGSAGAGAGTSAGAGGSAGTGGSSSGAGSSGGSSAAGSADSAGAGAGADGANGSAGAGPNVGGKIDLNTADSTALQTLPGVGPVTAEAIVTHRQDQPFASVEDLLLVQGIGPKTFERLKDLVSVG